MDKDGISEKLMDLYRRCGYTRYRMSKFEEYDLYSRNREFLPSDQIITFTDTDGRLMALKPDVTLSIVKNSLDGEDARLYYSESVFRCDRGSGLFAEIPQTGLEYIGKPDPYRLSEVLMLAGMSLQTLSDGSVLDVSHLGIISAVLDRARVTGAERAALLSCIGKKNVAGAVRVCGEAGCAPEAAELVTRIMTLDPDPGKAFAELYALSDGAEWDGTVKEFESIIGAVPYGGIRIDMSTVNDTDYYNGIVFRGYIDGVPFAVLSGGQYDKLMKKTGKNNSAAGFAIYLDRLDFIESRDEPYCDTLILYGEDTDPEIICKAISEAVSNGKSASAYTELPDNVGYGSVKDLR